MDEQGVHYDNDPIVNVSSKKRIFVSLGIFIVIILLAVIFYFILGGENQSFSPDYKENKLEKNYIENSVVELSREEIEICYGQSEDQVSNCVSNLINEKTALVGQRCIIACINDWDQCDEGWQFRDKCLKSAGCKDEVALKRSC